MKKKVNVFGKGVPVFVLVLLGMGIVSAMLVTYLSGSITGNVIVSSPMEFTAISQSSDGDCTLNSNTGEWTCAGSIYGGEVYSITTTLTKKIAGTIPNMYSVVKVTAFDNVGITPSIWFGDNEVSEGIRSCLAEDGNTYYYIGGAEGYDWSIQASGYSETSTVKMTTDLNLEPKTYNFEVGVVLAGVDLPAGCNLE